NPDPSPGDQGDGSGSNFEFQVVRLFYSFVPARGSGGSPRSGYVTRLIPSSAAPSLGSIYLYGNPPALSWSSPGPIGSSVAAPDWSANDQTATPAVAVPGIYTLTKAYDLTNNAWLLHTADANQYDSASHGTDVIVSRRTTGTISLKIGNFPDIASVVAVHAGTTAADFEYIWNAVTGDYYRLVVAAPSTDPAAFWRITRPLSPAGRIVQAYHIIGHRANTTAYNVVLASYDNFISPGGAADSALDYLPTTPPKEHFYSAETTSAAVDHTTVYSVNDTADDLGNGTTDRLGRTVGGPDLWCWKWAPHVAGYLGGVAVANSWDWVTGNAPTLAAWGALTGNSTANLGNYAALVHLTSPTGPRYYKGSPVDGDPLAMTTGIVQY
ncbi:MAG: hypothetical protein KA004_17450, partial [Verrucomicrobiales bacterium]|nr:hypothetical protein [Verrucomicrobiales bacterium]